MMALSTKVSTLLLLLVLAYTSRQLPQMIMPEAPAEIKMRTVSGISFYNAFIETYCTCDAVVQSCDLQIQKLNIPQTNFFNPEKLRKAARSEIIIENVRGNYQFPNRNLINVDMKYALFLPTTSNIKGIVLNFQPTLLGIRQTPIKCQKQITAIAGLYVSQGYAVLFPNYLGYYQDDHFPHPYILYPQINVKSAILALNHALFEKIKPAFPTIKNLSLFSVGYSEGASYALWLEKCLQSKSNCFGAELDTFYIYKGSCGLDGPYDLFHVVKQYLVSKVRHKPQSENIFGVQTQPVVNFGKPGLLAITLISYIYYTLGSKNYESYMNKDFFNMVCSQPIEPSKCLINGYQINLAQALNFPKDSLTIVESIANSAFDKKVDQRYLSSIIDGPEIGYQNGYYNSGQGLTNKSLLNSLLFNQTLKNASAINNSPKMPVFLFSLKNDSLVSILNTQNYIKKCNQTRKITLQIYNNEQHKVCPIKDNQPQNIDHIGAQLIANIYALAFVQNHNI